VQGEQKLLKTGKTCEAVLEGEFFYVCLKEADFKLSLKMKQKLILLFVASAFLMIGAVGCAKETGCAKTDSMDACKERCAKGRLIARYEYNYGTRECCCE
jgi:hypothetical protein